MARNESKTSPNDLLYWTLLVVVLCLYFVPIVLIITFLFFVDQILIQWTVSLVGAGLLAATFIPVWNWIQPRIYQLVYALDDPQIEMIGKVSDSLTQSTPEESMLSTIAETIADTIRLPYVKLEAVTGAAGNYGRVSEQQRLETIEIKYQDGIVGWMYVATRLPRLPFNHNEYALLNSLARQIGLTLHASQMGAALQASREKLVLTREEERRRIRNDLHDGLGPTLAALRLQLGVAKRLIHHDPAEAGKLLDELREDASRATADIRHLVYELRPPMLDELGLAYAIRNFKLGDAPLKLEVTAPEPMPSLSAAVEVAVYRIASEAIHNVIKHANATLCLVNIDIQRERLTLIISDDGTYLPENHTTGIGMLSMEERAAELGGTFSIQPGTLGGASILVHLPLEPTESHSWTS